MLEHLSITNFALITKLSIDFHRGFNILTGETGAGKSILIGAIGLILGQKGDTSLIRTGCDEACVTALLSIRSQEALSFLESEGIVPDEGGILIRRTLRSSGRGVITIQDEPVTRSTLQALSRLLFDMHGQHSHQSLLHAAMQRRLLDRYGELQGLAGEYRRVHGAYIELSRELEEAKARRAEDQRELEILEYAIEEIDAARLLAGEDEQLEKEVRRISSYEKLLTDIDQARGALGGRSGVIGAIRGASSSLDDAAALDEGLKPFAERVESVVYEIEDILQELRRYAEHISFSPAQLDSMQERQSLIRSLKKKYAPDIEGILSYRQEAQDRSESITERLEKELKDSQELIRVKERMKRLASELTEARSQTARKLEPIIMGHLRQLGMSNARFSVQITPRVNGEGALLYGTDGTDHIEFYISANSGEPVKPIKDTASGGELSRIMLALKTVFSQAESIDTLIFDEIDAGIGGTVALSVADHLKGLSEHRQILCISHLATVASRADAHLVVRKSQDGQRTSTSVTRLSEDQRVAEIARMLSGSADQRALEHAHQLLGF